MIFLPHAVVFYSELKIPQRVTHSFHRFTSFTSLILFFNKIKIGNSERMNK